MIGEVLQPGNDVLIDDGLVRLRVERMDSAARSAGVIVGGAVTSHKGVNLPGVPLPIPSLTRKDLADLDVALELGVDFVALSFVRSAADVRDLRYRIEEAGSTAQVIAKIEKADAVQALDEILAESDAVMVARGDLGVEIGPTSVPLLQKLIITKALERGKPVITATQMLESMIVHAEPTRAEASDVANAILDGTSAVMLSGETAMGEYPVEAVAFMDRIAREVEPSLGYRHETAGGEREPVDLERDVERRLRPRRGAGGEGDPRPDLQRPHRIGGRAAAPAAADRRPLAPPALAAADGARVGRDAARDRRGRRRRGALENLDRRRPGRRARREGRPVVITAGTSVNMPGTTNVIKVEVA